MPASWKVYTDWNADGDFVDAREDITSRVLDDRTALTMTYGRDQARSQSPTRVGEAAFELNNISRDYSPENSSSPLSGLVIPGRPIKVEATLGGTTYTPFFGSGDDFTVKADFDQRSVDITCVDGLSELSGLNITTQLWTGLRTGEAVHKVLDAAGWPAALRDIDVGATVMPYWWVDNADAMQALQDLVDSEGPYALVTCDSAGRIVFRDRHHRSLRTRSLTAQSTWYSRTSEPLFSEPFAYDHGWKEIINSVSFEIPIRFPSALLSTVWQSPGRITVASGATVAVTVKGTSPFTGAITPVSGTDYTATGTVTLSMPRSSGESTTIYLTAPSGVATVDNLQVRAYTLDTMATVVVSGEDSSITRYGRRTSTALRPPVWAGIHDAAAVITLILAQRAERLPTITVTMRAANATRQVQQLTRDLSDRVRIVEYELGLDADCWIEQISHTVTGGGTNHSTTFGLEKAPTQVTGALILGTGLLGTGKLGRRGLLDPTQIFTLGSASNAVLGTDILAA